MNPIKIEGAKMFGAPRDWDPAVDGECIGLPVIVNGVSHVSVWKFTAAERANIAKGWNMALSVVGCQPPVLLMAVDVDGEIVRFAGDDTDEPVKPLKISVWDFWCADPWFELLRLFASPFSSAKHLQ